MPPLPITRTSCSRDANMRGKKAISCCKARFVPSRERTRKRWRRAIRSAGAVVPHEVTNIGAETAVILIAVSKELDLDRLGEH